ncbi:MAG TPA: hypothetical protein VGF84_05680, partial [Micromonosporaceae bacterium]
MDGSSMTPRLSASYTPAISVSADGRVDVVAVDSQGGLVHCHLRDRLAGYVAESIHDTRVFAGSPVLIRRPDGGLDVFCRDVRGHVRHSRHTDVAGWSAWQTIGVTVRPRAAGPVSGGHRAGTHNEALAERVFRPLVDVRIAAGISAVVCGDGHIELFASDLNRALWRSVEVAGVMAPWRSVAQPSLYTEVSAALGPHGGPILAGASRDGTVWAGCIDGVEVNPQWSRLDAHVTGAPMILGVRNRCVIVGRGADARPWHAKGNGYGGWSAWAPVPGAPLFPADLRVAGASDASGELGVCAKGIRGEILHVRDVVDRGWSEWSPIGGPVVSQVNVAADPDRGVHIVGVGPGGRLIRIWHQRTE